MCYKKISAFIISLLISFTLSAQVKSYFGGTLNVFGSSGTSPEYTIQGFFNDTSGEYPLDSVAVGDILYISEGSTCVRLRVDTINSSAGGILDADVYDIDTILLAPPSGIGALMRETPNSSLPRYVPGLSETLLSCIRTHMTGEVDQEIAAAGDGNGLIDALPNNDIYINANQNNLSFNNMGLHTIDPIEYNIDTRSFEWNNISPQLNRKFFFGTEYTHNVGVPAEQESGRVAMRLSEGSLFQMFDEVTLQFQNISGSPEIFMGHHDGFLISTPPYGGDESLRTYNRLGGVFIDGNGITIKGEGFESGSEVLKYYADYSSTYTDRSIPDVEYVNNAISTAADGNGIISALPAAPINIDANGNALIIDSTSTTRLGAVGTAQGDLIVSGNTSLPSSLSHIVGADTSQINIQANTGISLNTDQNINFNVDGVSTSWPTTAPSANQVLSEGATDDGVLEWVDLPAADGNGIISELPNGDVTIDANENNLYLDNLTELEIYAGISSDDYFYMAEDYIIMATADLNETSRVEIDPFQATMRQGTSPNYAAFTVSATVPKINGIVSGTPFTYDFPRVSPAAAADSLDRALVWRKVNATTTSSFKVINDGDFRTASVSGNILPYDDIIECVPDVTVSLPAPNVKYQGKIYHIYVGGAGAGSGVTIDVVDGSSTIETAASLSMTSAWETYTLTCNGSQWVVLNHKP